MNKKLLAFLMPVLMATVSVNAHDSNDNPTYEGVVYVDPENLDWTETVYPGTEISTVFGDPTKAGQMYTIRFRLPANYTVPPHTHTQDEYMTVISGSLNVGIGEEVDKDSTIFLPEGGAVGIPSKVPHYAWTTEEMVMQVHAMGPRDTCFVHSQE